MSSIYSKTQLIHDIKQNPHKHREYLFFWREYEKRTRRTRKNQTRNELKHRVSQTCFSQWFASPFQDQKGTEYQTAEHYMMAQKALKFGDYVHFNLILKASTPKEVKALGRKVSPFDPEAWDDVKFEIVVQGNLLKFNQNPKLKAFLLSTQDQILVEASPYDQIWGIGLREDDQDAKIPSKWPGENLLGFALMKCIFISR